MAQEEAKPTMIAPWAHLGGGEAAAAPSSVARWEVMSGCQLCTTAGAGAEGWLCEQTHGSLQYQARELVLVVLERWLPQKRETLRPAQGNWQEK